MQYITFVILILCSFITVTAHAQYPDAQEVAEAFKSVKEIPPISVVVPTVVSVPFDTQATERSTFAVYEEATGKFVPYLVTESYTTKPILLSAYSEQADAYALIDGDSLTSAEFFLEEEMESTAVITLTAKELIESSSIVLELDRFVALPTRLSVVARVDGTTDRTILAPTRPTSNVITFPKTSADTWVITLTYAQPLRINELRLLQDNAEKSVTRNIRFLAQPKSRYRVYHDSDRSVHIETLERGNLSNDEGVRALPAVLSRINERYVPADADQDGIIDLNDNCVHTENNDQLDIDGNGRGDACDDFDRDGVLQLNDNCPNDTNAQQEDTDGDGLGDACDTEESRPTEKYPWVPWAGMGIAALVLGVLFVLVGTAPKKQG